MQIKEGQLFSDLNELDDCLRQDFNENKHYYKIGDCHRFADDNELCATLVYSYICLICGYFDKKDPNNKKQGNKSQLVRLIT